MMLTYFTYQLSTTLQKYYQYDTTTDIQVHHAESVQYPSVSFCNQNSYRWVSETFSRIITHRVSDRCYILDLRLPYTTSGTICHSVCHPNMIPEPCPYTTDPRNIFISFVCAIYLLTIPDWSGGSQIMFIHHNSKWQTTIPDTVPDVVYGGLYTWLQTKMYHGQSLECCLNISWLRFN